MNELSVDIPSGTYVLAVSGGVDSMVLLDLLSKKPDLKLIVTHFDHGIRPDSQDDLLLVKKTSKKYKYPFVFNKVNLGPGTSESEARKARYEFLKSVKEATKAKAIITAHHQDDILETAILNILRGTNRKGMSSLGTTKEIIRPLSHIEKSLLYKYAENSGIEWREDSTNQDINYRRNYIRHKILTRFDNEQKQKLIDIIKRISITNKLIDTEVKDYLDTYSNGKKLNRNAFIILPHSVAVEIMASWLRQNGVRDFNSKILEVLTIGAKTLKPKQRLDVNLAYFLEINKDSLALINREC
jgi:tRNA(Ile)-lysidine synthetase-like protein